MRPSLAGSWAAALAALLAADPLRMAALRAVRDCALPNGWIGAGFVRDAVWDHLHSFPVLPPMGDVDVLWHDPRDTDPARDRVIERRLIREAPGFDWSVKNQARMHGRNGDRPYESVADAMCHWPETATAVAVRLTGASALEVESPLGLDDLFGLRLVPTAAFLGCKRAIFTQRVADKRWLARYPMLVE